MRLRSELVLLASLAGLPAWAADTDTVRPRGVGPEFAKFYESPSNPATFTCISHPTIIIPYSRVNDDFCDCPDGSDEPGTSACSYLSPLSPPHYRPGIENEHFVVPANQNVALALPGFYCKNKGHISSYLNFESVNDGICDYARCCDGSDEYAGVGGVKCPDKCAEMGKEYRKHDEIRNKALRNALKKKQELMATAKKLKAEVELKIRDVEAEMLAKEKKVEQARETLKDVERKERLKVVKSDAAGKGKGKTGVLLGLAKGRVEELRTQLQKTQKHRDNMLDRVTELESILSALKREWNPNFNDEGVKKAVRSWEDYAVRETDDHWSEAQQRDLDAVVKEDGEDNGINWAEFEGSDEDADDTAALYHLMNYLPSGLQLWVYDRTSEIKKLLVDNGILAGSGTDAPVAESKAIQQAKTAVEEAEKDVQNAKSYLNDAKSDLDKDYGPGSIFRALKDHCVQKDSGEYVYELCYMKSTMQKPKKGGSNTGMGNFVGFETEHVDEEVPLDGKGLGRGERVVMKFENGQHCWNGPNRSTKVVMACSEHEEIWKVSESEKCVYRMEVGTAAVCGFKNGDKQAADAADSTRGGQKDEL